MVVVFVPRNGFRELHHFNLSLDLSPLSHPINIRPLHLMSVLKVCKQILIGLVIELQLLLLSPQLLQALMPLKHFGPCSSSLRRVKQFDWRKRGEFRYLVLRQELTKVVDLDGERLGEFVHLVATHRLVVQEEETLVAVPFNHSTHDRISTEPCTSRKLDFDTSFSAAMLNEFAGIFGTS